jgi:WD40 repeat protein
MKRIFSLVLFILSFVLLTTAADTSIWTVNSRADVLGGDSRGVSIDDTGAITIAPKLAEVFKTEQPYIWSSVVDPAGNVYLGTGGDGRIFKVDTNGKGSLFSDLNELNVSALVIGKSGELFAATSPDGKVYRIDSSGKADVYFDPKEKYIWSLALMPDGSLAVGTGENGKIFRVKSANATPESSLVADTSQTHIVSLATDKQGNLYAGTDSNGLVLRIGADGKPFALLDSPLRELHQIAVAPDGSIYALAIGESVATAKPAETPAPAAAKPVSATKPGPTTPETPQKSRYDLTGAKSAVYRIMPDGAADILWASSTISGFSIAPNQSGDGVLIGTSDKGRIYNVTNDGRETLLLQTDANQISTLRPFGKNIFATSSNQGSLFKFGSETAAEGSYESAVLDAKSFASWGRIWWRSAGNVQIQTRSGNTGKPDETWSAWSNSYTDQAGAQIASPKAKYLQWRAVLRPAPGAASLNEVNVSFLPRNIAPEVLSIQILPTNVGLVPNPPIQIDPNIELSGLDPQDFGMPNAAVAPRKVYQRAARSLQWTAEDRNGDKLLYDVYFKQVNEATFKLLKENLDQNFLTVDGQSLADGQYIFKIVAKDSPSNPTGVALSGDRISDPIDIDNTPPVVTAIGTPQTSGDRARVTFDAQDAASYISRAEYSVNGGDWQTVYPEDGISDGPKERYSFDVSLKGTGEHVVTLRVFDANGNAGNARVLVKQ